MSLKLLARDAGLLHGKDLKEAVEYIINVFRRRGWRDIEDKLQEALNESISTYKSDGGASPKTYLMRAFLWSNGNIEGNDKRVKRGKDFKHISLQAEISSSYSHNSFVRADRERCRKCHAR